MRPEPHAQDLEVEIFMYMLQNQLSDSAPDMHSGQAPQASAESPNTRQRAQPISRYGVANPWQAWKASQLHCAACDLLD